MMVLLKRFFPILFVSSVYTFSILISVCLLSYCLCGCSKMSDSKTFLVISCHSYAKLNVNKLIGPVCTLVVSSTAEPQRWMIGSVPPKSLSRGFFFLLAKKNHLSSCLPFSILRAAWGRELGLLLFKADSSVIPTLSPGPLLTPVQGFSALAMVMSWAR